MQAEQGEALLHRVTPIGRTYYDSDGAVLYLSYSCSAVELCFQGTVLVAEVAALPSTEYIGMPPYTDQTPTRENWAVAAVYVDGKLTKRIALAQTQEQILLYLGHIPALHTVRLEKLTENYKTYLGLMALYHDGTVEPTQADTRPLLTVVGDSITCGYGNLTTEPGRGYFPLEEDGAQAYGALAARILGYRYQAVCVSGIALNSVVGGELPTMREIYPYRDAPLERRLGKASLTPWDFEAEQTEVLVVNLGTNDAYAALFSGDLGMAETRFTADYTAFLRDLRRWHGPGTKILCTLGPMQYYMYDSLERAVAQHRRETGDKLVWCRKYSLMNPMDGAGAGGHPTVATHRVMAQTLADWIRGLTEPLEIELRIENEG